MRLWMNEPLKAHTTFQIGGPAEELAAPESEEELLALLARAPALVLGAGSNLLVRDAGVAGLTVLLGKDFARIEIERSRPCARDLPGWNSRRASPAVWAARWR